MIKNYIKVGDLVRIVNLSGIEANGLRQHMGKTYRVVKVSDTDNYYKLANDEDKRDYDIKKYENSSAEWWNWTVEHLELSILEKIKML